MSPETKTEPTVAVELNLPQSVLRQLDDLAEAGGKDRNGVIVQLVEATKPLTLAEVLAPVHEEFRRSGMSEDELNELLESELQAHRRGE